MTYISELAQNQGRAMLNLFTGMDNANGDLIQMEVAPSGMGDRR
jgi:hypothetical protein